MTTQFQNLALIDAVETLSNIADLEFDHEIGIAQKHEIVFSNEKMTYRTAHWLHHKNASSTIHLVRETFRVILYYLKHFYKKEYAQVTDQKTLDEIKTVMVLVQEAAKKLDQYMHIFQQAQPVTSFEEFKQLQEFYQNKIDRQVNEGSLGKWILGLNIEKLTKSIPLKADLSKNDKIADTQHVFVNLETVKKDLEYELFFIRKEDGSRFFSSRLLRNIKLVCDFGNYFGERKELDPLEHIKQWQDRIFHVCAKEILKVLGSRLNHFFEENRQVKDQELLVLLKKALLALMLSSHNQNLLRHHPIKSCTEYFEDFQQFLRQILQTRTYQKWVKDHPEDQNKLAFDLIAIIHTLSKMLYANLQGLDEMKPVIDSLIQEAKSTVSRQNPEKVPTSNLIWTQLAADYAALSLLLKHHSNGPLHKAIEVLEANSFHVFDSLLQHNLPNQLFDLYTDDKRLSFLRIPAPIYQEFINKAFVNEEFKGFIRACQQEGVVRKHLLINLQDRTSWREHARCFALENLQNLPEMVNSLSVVTLATETDFYHQLAPYHQVDSAHLFKEQFKELVLDENAGYFFPATLNKQDISQFIDQAFTSIHQLFFSSKNVMTRENRLDFIEIVYLLLQLKLMEWIQPNTVSLTCKDSIDIGEAYSAGIFVFLKLIQQQEWTEIDAQHVNFMLYAPALLLRERSMLPERFNRILSALKTVENTLHEWGAEKFAKMMQKELFTLYQTPILHSHILLPR